MATSHSVPPMKTIEPGNSRRDRPVWAELLTGLSTERPQKRTRDDMALDFACALPDAFDACIAPDAFERQVVHQSHAAMDLNGFIGDHRKAFSCLELRHGHVHVFDRALIVLPGSFQRDEPGRLELGRHVGKLEGYTLELSNLLTELCAGNGPLLGMVERTFGAADAGGGDLQSRRPEPCIRHFETFMQFTQNSACRHAAVGELENAIVVAPVRDVAVALPYRETRRALVDKEGGNELLPAAWGLLLPRCSEKNDEIGHIRMADKMLGAIDDKIFSILAREAFHAAHVRSGSRLGHGKTVGTLSTHRGEEISFTLLTFAGHENVGRTRDAIPVERIVGATEFSFVQNPGQSIEPGAADFGRHVGGIEARRDRLMLQFLAQILAQHAGALDLRLMREQLRFDEGASRLHNHLLLFAQGKVHLSLSCVIIGHLFFTCFARLARCSSRARTRPAPILCFLNRCIMPTRTALRLASISATERPCACASQPSTRRRSRSGFHLGNLRSVQGSSSVGSNCLMKSRMPPGPPAR